jgi:serine/threonine protein kinase
MSTKQRLSMQIFGMVNVMHSHGVFHQDLAAPNILINSCDGDAQLRLVDFEFAKLATRDTEHRFLKRWRHFDIGDLEETLMDMKLLDEGEIFDEKISRVMPELVCP